MSDANIYKIFAGILAIGLTIALINQNVYPKLANLLNQTYSPLIMEKVLYEISSDNNDIFRSKIFARYNGKRYELISGKSTGLSINLISQLDFDSDGQNDALMSLSTGGNCCKTDYKIVSFLRDETYSISSGSMNSWMIPEFKEGRFEIKGDTSLSFYKYKMRDLSISEPDKVYARITALFEINKNQVPDDNKFHIFLFDMNSDGKKDEVFCKYWWRWGSIQCGINVNGKILMEANVGCERFGVLDTKSEGYNDVVCNENGISHFDGNKYTE